MRKSIDIILIDKDIKIAWGNNMYNVGETVFSEKVKKKIINILTNTRGQPIIEWRGGGHQGACMMSTWREWKDGIDLKKKRAQLLCVCEKNRQRI